MRGTGGSNPRRSSEESIANLTFWGLIRGGHREDVCKITVVVVGPDVLAGLGLNQLRGHAGAIAGSAHAAFEHIPYARLAADLLHIDDAAFVGEAGIACDDEFPNPIRANAVSTQRAQCSSAVVGPCP